MQIMGLLRMYSGAKIVFVYYTRLEDFSVILFQLPQSVE